MLGAIACGAIYLVLTPVLSGPPPIPSAVSEPSRPLAYEQSIARTAPDEAKPEEHAMAPADVTPTETAPAQDAQAALPAEGAETSAPADDMAALPPDEGACGQRSGLAAVAAFRQARSCRARHDSGWGRSHGGAAGRL